ncbi:MAG: hypothetical protein M1814_005912 [Vezdaea aestivalis]|nr:MAG: hypothetical protein M1814_005912 [Vezdaea aestivalis]
MSLKQEIETWVQALNYYDNNEFEEALSKFTLIADTSKIFFNCGIIHATLGAHGKAVECYRRAIELDQFLAVAYFQQGVSNFLIGEFEEAAVNFNDTLIYLRGNLEINYEQLGLKFKLYSCEVLFNRGLCYIYLQETKLGMQDLIHAVKEKREPSHQVIDEAIMEEAKGYMVFSIQVGTVYRPNAAKVKNLKTKDYLGKARLVAAAEAGSHGIAANPEARRNMLLEQIAKDDRSPDSISYAATNLVNPNLRSHRTRQQSEPPLHRQVFPPTPPPEDRTPPLTGGTTLSAASITSAPAGDNRPPRSSSRGPARKPEALTLLHSNTSSLRSPESGAAVKPRRGTIRTASEPRAPSTRQMYGAPRSKSKDRNQLRDRPQIQTISAVEDFEPSRERFSGASQDSFKLRPMSGSSNGSIAHRRGSSRLVGYEQSIIEEDEGEEDSRGSSGSYDSEASTTEFEIMSPDLQPPKRDLGRAQSRTRSRRPEIRKIRVKVHFDDDTRNVMITPMTEFDDFKEGLREKLKLQSRFKIKIKDDGDLITMGDQDDLDMAISTSKSEARRKMLDMGRMEVWVSLVAPN